MSSSTKAMTVEDVSSSSSPSSSPSASASTGPEVNESVGRDQPIDSLGEEDEEWDPAEERLPGQSGADSKGKGKDKDEDQEEGKGEASEEQPWQAVWSPEQNAWYFWNTKSGEVTWTNPLQPEAGSSSTPAGVSAPPLPNEAPPLPSGPIPSSIPSTSHIPPDIDPDLAHLLPPAQRLGVAYAAGGDASQKALFNARTGRFTAQDYSYTPEHLEEYNRAKRMKSHYFDVDAWERERAEENAKRKREEEEGGSVKQKITKKDMQRFRQKAAEKKARSQAWLRE